MTALQEGYILHRYPFQCDHLLLKIFTPDGLQTAIAKYVKRPKSPWRGCTEPFTHCAFAVSGKGEVKTLKQLEVLSSPTQLDHITLCSALYANELLLSMIKPNAPHQALFAAYGRLLASIEKNTAESLRRFEVSMLEHLGVWSPPQTDQAGAALDESLDYIFEPGSLPQAFQQKSGYSVRTYKGCDLLALCQEQRLTTEQMRTAKQLLAEWLDVYTEGRAMRARNKCRALII